MAKKQTDKAYLPKDLAQIETMIAGIMTIARDIGDVLIADDGRPAIVVYLRNKHFPNGTTRRLNTLHDQPATAEDLAAITYWVRDWQAIALFGDYKYLISAFNPIIDELQVIGFTPAGRELFFRQLNLFAKANGTLINIQPGVILPEFWQQELDEWPKTERDEDGTK